MAYGIDNYSKADDAALHNVIRTAAVFKQNRLISGGPFKQVNRGCLEIGQA